MKFKKGSVRRSLHFSLVDGLFTAMMMGVSESYLVPYGIALGATPGQVAFLASVPALVGAVLQIRSAEVTAHIGSRLKLINFVVFFHAVAWLPIIFIPYLLSSNSGRPLGPWILLAAATVFTSFGAFAVPAWQSLMSDYIPVKKRGHYFGWRNRLQGFLTVSVSIAAGFLLNYYGKNRIVGFTIIFVFAMVCRFMAWTCLLRMSEPFRRTTHDDYFSFWDFVKGMRNRNFARFVLFVSLMSFAVNISAPLLPVFLLQDLHFDYVAYMMVMTTAAFSGFFFQKQWGYAADRSGNIRVLKIAGWGIALVPIFWISSRNLVYLFFVQLVAGAFWGGFNLLVLNFIMEATTPEKRIRCISYFNVTNTAALFVGALCGGALIHHLPTVSGYSYLALFLLSCAGRLLVMVFTSKMVKEVRTSL